MDNSLIETIVSKYQFSEKQIKAVLKLTSSPQDKPLITLLILLIAISQFQVDGALGRPDLWDASFSFV